MSLEAIFWTGTQPLEPHRRSDPAANAQQTKPELLNPEDQAMNKITATIVGSRSSDWFCQCS